ncbi:ribonuclease H-like domain-containing protein [Tanacetum coccineum]
MRAKRYYQRTGKKIFINANDTAGYDKSKVECFNCHKMRHFARECRASRNKEGQFRNQDNTRKQGNNEDTSSKAMLAIDGVGFDWSDMAEELVQTNMALMTFLDSEVYNDKTCSKTCLKNYETLKKLCDDLIVKLNQTEFTAATYKRGLATVEEQLITYRKNEVLFSEEVAVLKREVACKDYEINVLKRSQIPDKSKKGLRYSVVPPPHPLIYNRPNKLDLSYSSLDEFKEPEFKGYEQVSKDISSFVESSLNVDKEIVFPVDKKVESVKPKNHEKPVKKSVRYAEMYRSQTPRESKELEWAKVQPTRIGKPQQDDTGFVDSGCSRHMTGNIAYLSNFKEFDRGYVTFGGGSHGGRISGKGTLKTDSLDFKDVYFVNELKFNLFSVSQMCDKKNYVLFTNTECFVLSPNFKLPDESQILLKIPRKHNIHIATGTIINESTGTQEELNAGKPTLGLWYSKDSPFKLVAYTDSDYAGATQDRKSTTRNLLAKVLMSGRHVKRGRDTKIPQSSGPPVKVGDEAVHKELGDRMERAATTASSLEAEQDSGSGPRCQDTILGDVDAQTRFKTTSKQSNDPPLSRGYTLGSGEDSMKLLELMELCTKLSKMLHKNRQSDLIRYALTSNPIIYTSCIQQFWATEKANIVNGKCQLQALINKKKVIITESSIRSDFHLEDAGGTDCLPTATIFEELAWMGSLKKQSRRKQRKDTAVTQEETQQDDSVPTPSNDPPLSEKAKDLKASRFVDLKKRVQKLERKKKSRTTGLKRLRKVGRSIEDIDKDADVSLVDDTQGRSDNEEMFDTNDLHGDEVNVDMPVGEKQEQGAKEREVDTSVEDSAAPTTIEEITLAQTLIQIKAAKPKVVTTAATTITTTRSKVKGVNKGKAIMIEPEVPLKRKDQVALDEYLVRNLQAQLEAELIEEERLARKKEEKANIALIKSWDNTQAMMEANFELAQRATPPPNKQNNKRY